jgi:hypothetical protein
MNEDTLKLISSIIVIILSILGFFWGVIKDWDRIPPKLKIFLGTIFKQGTAWLILLIVSCIAAFSVWAERNPATYPIEKAPTMTSILYEGARNPDINQGTGVLETTYDTREGKTNTVYSLNYDLPQEGDAYSGVALWFAEPLDLSEYNFIELTISFSDDQSRCRFFIKDGFKGEDFVLLGDGSIISAKTQPQVIKLGLSDYFPAVARKAIREIDLDANNYVTQGNHSFKVSKIQFSK